MEKLNTLLNELKIIAPLSNVALLETAPTYRVAQPYTEQLKASSNTSSSQQPSTHSADGAESQSGNNHAFNNLKASLDEMQLISNVQLPPRLLEIFSFITIPQQFSLGNKLKDVNPLIIQINDIYRQAAETLLVVDQVLESFGRSTESQVWLERLSVDEKVEALRGFLDVLGEALQEALTGLKNYEGRHDSEPLKE